MFYWLDSFIHCLPVGCGFEPHLLYHFLTFYADLTKWPEGLTDRPSTVSRQACCVLARVVARGRWARVGPPFGHQYGGDISSIPLDI
jgi:hypothetical protein